MAKTGADRQPHIAPPDEHADEVKPARYRKQLSTLQMVERMARRGDTWEDIGDILGISVGTISRRGYTKAIQRGHAIQRARIRKRINQLLNEGNAQVAIHLARSVLGQNYKVEAQLPPDDREVTADLTEMKRDVLRRLARLEAEEQKQLRAGREVEEDVEPADDGTV